MARARARGTGAAMSTACFDLRPLCPSERVDSRSLDLLRALRVAVAFTRRTRAQSAALRACARSLAALRFHARAACADSALRAVRARVAAPLGTASYRFRRCHSARPAPHRPPPLRPLPLPLPLPPLTAAARRSAPGSRPSDRRRRPSARRACRRRRAGCPSRTPGSSCRRGRRRRTCRCASR
jgi:hypothetical protein